MSVHCECPRTPFSDGQHARGGFRAGFANHPTLANPARANRSVDIFIWGREKHPENVARYDVEQNPYYERKRKPKFRHHTSAAAERQKEAKRMQQKIFRVEGMSPPTSIMGRLVSMIIIHLLGAPHTAWPAHP